MIARSQESSRLRGQLPRKPGHALFLGDLPGTGGTQERDTFKVLLLRSFMLSGTIAPSYIVVFTVARVPQSAFWPSSGRLLGGFQIPLSGGHYFQKLGFLEINSSFPWAKPHREYPGITLIPGILEPAWKPDFSEWL